MADNLNTEMLQIWINLLKTAACFEASVMKKELPDEDEGRPLCDYLLPKQSNIIYNLPKYTRENSVKFVNLKHCYEKIQRRRDGISAQMPMNCSIRMCVIFDQEWRSPVVEVFVQRHPESAKLSGDVNGRVKLDVIRENRQGNKQYFSVNLDSVYKTRFDTSVYKLSTVDPLRRNRFFLVVRISCANQITIDTSQPTKKEQFFTSPSFQVRSRRALKTKTIQFTETKESKLAQENEPQLPCEFYPE